jgi:hypothetical protein
VAGPHGLRRDPRIGLNDGELYAQIAAPLYVTVPVWSRASIGLGYAAALIAARCYDEAVALLEDPIIAARALCPQGFRRRCGRSCAHARARQASSYTPCRLRALRE